MKLHYLLGTRIQIAATDVDIPPVMPSIMNLMLVCKRLHTYTVSLN
jgi:hypothetical protein